MASVASLQQLVRELREVIRKIDSLPPEDLGRILDANDRAPIALLDRQIAVECEQLGILSFPHLGAPGDKDHVSEFGFIRLPYAGLTADRGRITKVGWWLTPDANWWQALNILEGLGEAKESNEHLSDDSFTLKDLLTGLGEVEWYKLRANDLHQKAQAAGNVNSPNSVGGHYSIQASIHSSQGAAKANELHSKPGVKLLNTVCLAKGKSFDRDTVAELCAALALQRGQTLDELLALDAENVVALLAETAPPKPQESRADARESSPPTESTNHPDGPYPPNSVRFSGRDAVLQPIAWHLLSYMWDRNNAPFDDVCQNVWGDPEKLVADRAVKNAILKVNAVLDAISVPWRLGIKSGHVVKKSPKSL